MFTCRIAFKDEVTADEVMCPGVVILVASFEEYQLMFAAVSCVCCSVYTR